MEEEIVKFYEPVKKEQSEKSLEKKTDTTHQDTYADKKREPYQPKPFVQRDTPRPQSAYQQEKSGYQERDLRIRKITDQTPLPPRKIETKIEEPKREPTKQEVYQDTRKIEEAFHKPPKAHKTENQGERTVKQESPLKNISVPTFDNKNAVSLKDALAKAMSEHNREITKVDEGVKEVQEVPAPVYVPPKKSIATYDDDTKKYNEAIELKIRKEIDEEVLRKLLED